MENFEELFKKSLVEGIFEVYPYVNKVADFFGVDREDMYDFIGESLAFTSMEELDKARENDEVSERDYEIHKKFFDSFGKDEFELTDEDLAKIGSTREEYDEVHNDLV